MRTLAPFRSCCRSSCLSRFHFPASLPSAGLCYSPLDHGIRLVTQSALGHLQYCEGSDSCRPSPRAAGLPAYLATPSQRSASNHAVYPGIALHAKPQRTGRVSGFALREEARRHIPPKRVRYPAHCQFALRLLPTPLHSDAVTFGYRVLAYPDTDSHRAVCAPSRAH